MGRAHLEVEIHILGPWQEVHYLMGVRQLLSPGSPGLRGGKRSLCVLSCKAWVPSFGNRQDREEAGPDRSPEKEQESRPRSVVAKDSLTCPLRHLVQGPV